MNLPPPDADVPCGACTACCKGRQLVIVSPVLGDQVDHLTLQHETVPDIGPVAALAWQANGDCVHLIDNRCEVYDWRPKLCRSFDCRESYAHTPRAEQRRQVKAGRASAAVFARGRELIERGDG